MSSQFKTFLKFALLAAIIITTLVVANKFRNDIGEYFFIPAILVFLVLLLQEISVRKPQTTNQTNIENVQSSAPQPAKERGKGRQILISSFITLVGILFMIFVGSFFIEPLISLMGWVAIDVSNKGIFVNIFLLLVDVIIFFVFFVKWVKAFWKSIEFRNEYVQNKNMQWKIFIDVLVMGTTVCFVISFFFFSFGYILSQGCTEYGRCGF